MNAIWSDFVGWLVDYQLLAGGLLIAALVAARLLRQPAHRLAALRPSLAGLAALALLCAAPGWSLVHLGGDATEVSEAQATPAPQPVAAQSAPSAASQPALPQPFTRPPFARGPQAPIDSAAAPPVAVAPADEPVAAEPAASLGPLGWAAATFLFGSAVATLWLAAGAIQARRLLRRAQPAPDEFDAVLARLVEGNAPPRLLVSAEIAVAAAIGWRRPTILLPQELLDNQDNNLADTAAALAHEWSHLRHGDLRTLAASRWLLVILWPQPLFWLVRRVIRLDQETLADADAAELTGRQQYAERLVAWARQAATTPPTPRLAAAVGLWENPSQLKRRVVTLLDEKFTVLRQCSRRWHVATTAAAAAAALLLSLVTLQPAPAEEQSADAGAANVVVTGGPQSEIPTGPGVRPLRSGGYVEILAIGTHGEAETAWWNAAGQPLTELPFEAQPATNISPTPNRQIVYRVVGLQDGETFVEKFAPATNSGEGAVIIDGRQDPRGYRCKAFDAKGKQFALQVGVARGEWLVISTGANVATGSLVGSSVISGPLADANGRTLAVVSHDLKDSDTRLLAVDKSGNEHQADRRSGLTAGGQIQEKYMFAGLTSADVDHFTLEARPYEWIQFSNLPTSPGAAQPQRNDGETRTAALTDEQRAAVIAALGVLTNDSGVDPVTEWGGAVRTIVEVGPAAVPLVTAALDEQQRDHPIRKLAFTLRALGDPRAVPALIRALPRTHLPPASDYGVQCDDKDLLAFLQQHHDARHEGATKYLNYHRAFTEVTAALQKLTGVGQRDMELIFVWHNGSEDQLARQRRQYEKLALRWAAWWNDNGAQLLGGAAVETANLPPSTPIPSPPDAPLPFPQGDDVRFGPENGERTVSVAGDAHVFAYCFLDLDTGRAAKWPSHLPSYEPSTGVTAEVRRWARGEGFDVVAVTATKNQPGPSRRLVLLDCEAWSLTDAEFEALPAALRGKADYPLHQPAEEILPKVLDRPAAGAYQEQAPAQAYLYRTRAGNHGILAAWTTLPDQLPAPMSITGVLVRQAFIYRDVDATGPPALPFTASGIDAPQPGARVEFELEVQSPETPLAPSPTDDETSSNPPAATVQLDADPGDSDPSDSTATVAFFAAATDPAARNAAANNAARTFLDANRPQANRVAGICLDETGQPIAGATVTLYLYESGGSQEPAQALGTTVTDADGAYRFADVIDAAAVFPNGVPEEQFQTSPVNILAVVARKSAYATAFDNQLATMILRQGEASVHLMAPAQTLRGRVVDRQGEPIAGAAVMANMYVNIPGVALGSATTDEDGRYTITDLAAYDVAAARKAHDEHVAKMKANLTPDQLRAMGATSAAGTFGFTPRQVRVHHPDYVLERVELDAIPGEANARLSPGGTLAGRVVRRTDHGDEPAAHRVVYVSHMPEEAEQPAVSDDADQSDDFVPWTGAIQMSTVSQTDGDGRYEVTALPPGSYYVAVNGGTDWVTPGLAGLTVAAGETTTADDVALTPGGILRVQLLDPATNQPMRLPSPRKGWISTSPVEVDAAARREFNSNNAVEFSTDGVGQRHINPGEYHVFVTLPKGRDGQDAELTSMAVRLPVPAGPDGATDAADSGQNPLDGVPVASVVEGEVAELRIAMHPAGQPRYATVMLVDTPPSEPAADTLTERIQAASTLNHQGQQGDALAAFESILKELPDEPSLEAAVVRNNVAYLLATCADEQLRDPARAATLAQEALETAQAADAPAQLIREIEATLAAAQAAN